MEKFRLRSTFSFPIKILRRSVEFYTLCLCLIFGKPFILSRLSVFSWWIGPVRVLRILGATVGPRTRIEPGIQVQNACGGDCKNMFIGEHVYIGPGCLFDLACPITIDDDAALSAHVSIVTHRDVGDRPLKKRFPREEGPVHIRRGAWIGVDTTVLHDVTVGEYAVIGAMSLVNQDICDNSVCFGIPCRLVRQFNGQPK